MTTENTTPTGYWLCPLYAFDYQGESADLNGGIQIKPAPSELREYISERTLHLYGLWEDPSKFNWAVFLPQRPAKVDGLSRQEQIPAGFQAQDRDIDSFVDLVTALRLCHSGRILAGPLISGTFNRRKWSVGGTTLWTSVSEKNFIIEDPKYLFRQDDIAQVGELKGHLDALRSAGKLDNLRIALGRFHSAYGGSIEDRMVDQMIAFESLYLSNEQELTYKLALRTSLLLRNRKDHRKKVFDDVKKAYGYRSRIVHGVDPPSRRTLRVVVPESQEYLRQSIRRFLELLSEGMSLDQIRKKLDENILSNGKSLRKDRSVMPFPTRAV